MTAYEQAARRRKAVAIADYCRAHKITAQWVTEMTATERREVCSLAFVNLASDETWAIVVGLLGAYEEMHPAIAAALPADPFSGLAPEPTMAEHFASLESDTWPIRPGIDDEKYGPRARND